MCFNLQMVEDGLMHRVTSKRKLTQRGELFVVWSLNSEDFCTRTNEVDRHHLCGWLHYNDLILTFELESDGLNGRLSTVRITGGADLKGSVFYGASFSLFLADFPGVADVGSWMQIVFVRPNLVSDQNLTSDRWVNAHSFKCVCEQISVFSYSSVIPNFVGFFERLCKNFVNFFGNVYKKHFKYPVRFCFLYIPVNVTLMNRK